MLDLMAFANQLSLFSTDKTEIIKAVSCLHKWGCCSRCCLRFMGEKQDFIFTMNDLEDLSKFTTDCVRLENQNNSHVTHERALPSTQDIQSCKPENISAACTTPAMTFVDDNCSIKTSLCVSCLGILQEQYCKDSFLDEIRQVVSKQDFDFSTFFCSLSLPVCLLLREHSLWLALHEILPHVFTPGKKDDVTPLKDVWKWVNGPQLASKLGVSFDQRSPFEILLTFIHPESDRECAFLYDLFPDVFRKRKHNKHGWEVFTRINVQHALSDTNKEKFRKSYHCPPRRLMTPCDCDPITGIHEALYIAGRYNKYSRALSQTPWLIDGTKKCETSIEEIVCSVLMKEVRASEFRFSASGREDVDVRMLGRGRPFVVEFINPHRVNISRDRMRQLKADINGSTNDVAVRDLQTVSREETAVLKAGEEEKIKRYTALCWSQDPLSATDLDRLNAISDLTLQQKTPMRVLHRRPLATRQRTVHSMVAVAESDPQRFRLSLSTQAGTYVKEFVHGDFGRTTPNLSSLLGTECDILELDVEAVELDWPKQLDE